MPDLVYDCVRSDLFADKRVERPRERLERGLLAVRAVKEFVTRVLIRREEFSDFLAQLRIVAAGLNEIRGPALGIEVESGVKDFFNPLPPVRAGWLWPG
jgi:hypothetical protein